MYDTRLSSLFGLELRALYHFLYHEDEWICLSDISTDLKANKMTMTRSLEKLRKNGIINERNDGYRRFFKLKDHYSIPTIKTLMNVDSEIIKGLIRSFKGSANVILLFGSRAEGSNRSDSDWDILVVSDSMDPIEMNKTSNRLEKRFGQELNLHLYTEAQIDHMRDECTPFYMEVIRKKVPLVGNIDDI